MPILADELSVWDIAFRWAGYDPSCLWLRLPLEVKDYSRLLMNAILSGEIVCGTMTLAKRPPDSKADPRFYIRTYIDEVYACIHGVGFDRKLLKWATVDRMDFHEWCGRRGIPLPEFWFPPSWNLEFEMPEFGTYALRARHIEPTTEGEVYISYEHPDTIDTEENRHADDVTPSDQNDSTPSEQHANQSRNEPDLRQSQRIKLVCQQIATVIWKDDPTRTIASVARDELIQKYGGGAYYEHETVREWVKVIAPLEVRQKRGRPRKENGDQEE